MSAARKTVLNFAGHSGGKNLSWRQQVLKEVVEDGRQQAVYKKCLKSAFG